MTPRQLFAIGALVACTGASAIGQSPRVPSRKPAPKVAPAPEPPPPQSPIDVKTSIDRGAVWIGDPVVYTIEITCPAGTDILAADISRDRLKVSNMDVVGSAQTREAAADGTIVYRAQYRLVSFAADGTHVGIEPLAVRYYVHTAGQPPESLVPADELHLPARTIAVRSSLPEGDVEWLRDEPRIARVPQAVRFFTPLGFVAVLMTLIPVLIGVTGVVQQWSPRRVSRPARRSMHAYRDELERVRALEASTDPESRRGVFEGVNDLVRDRLTDIGIRAHSLSADEIERLAGTTSKHLPAAADIGAVLRDCERAMYGRPEDMPDASAAAAALAQADTLLRGRR